MRNSGSPVPSHILLCLFACCEWFCACACRGRVLTMQQSRWADTPAIDRSTPERHCRPTASGSRRPAPLTSLPPPPSWPGWTADGHHPGQKQELQSLFSESFLCESVQVELTDRAAPPNSIFNRPMALMMAMMDWMVLLYTTNLYCLHSSSE